MDVFYHLYWKIEKILSCVSRFSCVHDRDTRKPKQHVYLIMIFRVVSEEIPDCFACPPIENVCENQICTVQQTEDAQ